MLVVVEMRARLEAWSPGGGGVVGAGVLSELWGADGGTRWRVEGTAQKSPANSKKRRRADTYCMASLIEWTNCIRTLIDLRRSPRSRSTAPNPRTTISVSSPTLSAALSEVRTRRVRITG